MLCETVQQLVMLPSYSITLCVSTLQDILGSSLTHFCVCMFFIVEPPSLPLFINPATCVLSPIRLLIVTFLITLAPSSPCDHQANAQWGNSKATEGKKDYVEDYDNDDEPERDGKPGGMGRRNLDNTYGSIDLMDDSVDLHG